MRSLIGPAQQRPQPLHRVGDRVHLEHELGCVLACAAPECRLDELGTVAEVPVEAAAARAERLGERVDGDRIGAARADRLERCTRPVVAREQGLAGACRHF
jgi:hypothetical protein